MMSTQTQKNNFQNLAAPQPVFVQVMPAPMFNFAPVMQPPFADNASSPTTLPLSPALAQPTLPQLTAPPAPTLPIFTPPLPLLSSPTLTQITNVPSTTPIMFYDGSSVSNVPSYLAPTIQHGVLTPPQGYSFATINFNPQLTTVGDTDSTGNVEDLTASSSREATPEPVEAQSPPAKRQARKFKHGSKQIRIMEVYNNIQKKYIAQGVYAGEHEVLRGADTVRVHVKTFKGLNMIEAALQEVDDCPDVRLRKLATPFSMKNRFQKKGFIVYLRLESPDMVDSVKAVFEKYKEYFRKCDVAMPKPTDPQPGAQPTESKISDFLDAADKDAPFFPLPLPMVKQTSAPGNAA